MSSALSDRVAGRLLRTTALNHEELYIDVTTGALDMALVLNSILSTTASEIDYKSCDEACARLVVVAHSIKTKHQEDCDQHNMHVIAHLLYSCLPVDRASLVLSCHQEGCRTAAKGNTPDSHYAFSLLLCCTIDRLLRDAHVTANPEAPVPLLLRDVMSSLTLVHYFGHATMQVLQLLMGAPTTINLRNLLWHGFIRDDELPSWAGTILWHVLIALCTKIVMSSSDGIEMNFNVRPLRELSHYETMRDHAELEALKLKRTEQILSNSGFATDAMRPLWTFALDTTANKELSTLLLLPLLEASLRKVSAHQAKIFELNNARLDICRKQWLQ